MILISWGTRPEYIKCKPLIDMLGNKCRVLFTGQHEGLSTKHHDYAITIHDNGNRLDSIIGSIMGELTSIFKKEPWLSHVLVHGDTTSALAVAISAFNHGRKVIHLEAGLRTYDLQNPFPEESNRRMIGQIASIHFCPTIENATNVDSLDSDWHVVGNTVIDSLVEYKERCEYGDVVIVTMHRRENHKNMDVWFREIDRLAEEHDELNFVFPIHPNPNVSKHVDLLRHVTVVSPMPRRDFLNVLVKAKMVITDSGGLQEESSYFNKICLVCRKVTERPESIGTSSFLVKEPQMLNEMFNSHIENYEISTHCPYGDGNSTKLIYDILMKELDDYSANSEYPAKG